MARCQTRNMDLAKVDPGGRKVVNKIRECRDGYVALVTLHVRNASNRGLILALLTRKVGEGQ